MKKSKKVLALLGLFCSAIPQLTHGQANDWIFPPNKRLQYTPTLGFASDLPGTSGISGCGAGSGYLWLQYAGVISDANGNGMAFVNGCGTYNITGAGIGSTVSPYTFAIPGLCKQYYSMSWEDVWGPPHYRQLVIRQLDASNPASISVVSTNTIATGNSGLSIALSPLAADGSRKVFFSDEGGLRCITIGATGTVSAVTPLQTFTTPVQVAQDPGMEVSPNGQKVVVCFLDGVKLYDVASNTFTTTLGTFTSSTSVVAGIEYVPYTGGGGDRVYFSYHSPAMAPSSFEGLGYVSLSAPTVLVDALGTLPAGLVKAGFGFTEIERAKNGYLHFAYHSAYASHWCLNGSVGPLYWIYPPVAGSFGAVANNTTTSAVADPVGYIIQKQIDGEDYDFITSTTANVPTFDVNAQVQVNTQVVPTIYPCQDALNLHALLGGKHISYTVKLEIGTISKTGTVYTFTPNATQPAGNSRTIASVEKNITLNLIDPVNGFTWLTSYSGPLRVTVTNNNNCGTSPTSIQFFNLVAPTDFLMFAPSDNSPYNPTASTVSPCSSSPVIDPVSGLVTRAAIAGAQDRNVIAPTDAGPRFAPIGVQNPTLPPPCSTGWLGASTVGIMRADLNLAPSVIGALSNYKVLVEEYTQPSGSGNALVFRQTILNRTLPSGIPPLGYLFDGRTNPSPANTHYFNSFPNYDLIKDNYVYKVTYSAISANCGLISSTSYFKILNDGLTADPDGGVLWKKVEPGNFTMPEDQLHVYPNPASTTLNMSWLGKTARSSKVIITNALGSTVKESSVMEINGTNNVTIDISQFAPGIYYYSKITDDGVQNGNFVKK